MTVVRELNVFGNKVSDSIINVNRTLNAVTDQWYSVNFQEDFTGDPIAITSIETYDGSDSSSMRIRELSKDGMEIMVEEEQSDDTEIEHKDEVVSYFAVKEGAIYNATGDIIGEAGKITRDQSGSTWYIVNTQRNYTNPVVFAQILTYNGDHPSHIRLKNVQNNSFEMQIEEWDYLNEDHLTENIGYIVLESGNHELAFGKKMEVGTVDTNQYWKNIYFDQDFNEAPITISRCQTYNGNQAIVTRQDNVRIAGFSVRLQEEEGNDDTHAVETIGYMAVDSVIITNN